MSLLKMSTLVILATLSLSTSAKVLEAFSIPQEGFKSLITQEISFENRFKGHVPDYGVVEFDFGVSEITFHNNGAAESLTGELILELRSESPELLYAGYFKVSVDFNELEVDFLNAKVGFSNFLVKNAQSYNRFAIRSGLDDLLLYEFVLPHLHAALRNSKLSVMADDMRKLEERPAYVLRLTEVGELAISPK